MDAQDAVSAWHGLLVHTLQALRQGVEEEPGPGHYTSTSSLGKQAVSHDVSDQLQLAVWSFWNHTMTKPSYCVLSTLMFA